MTCRQTPIPVGGVPGRSIGPGLILPAMQHSPAFQGPQRNLHNSPPHARIGRRAADRVAREPMDIVKRLHRWRFGAISAGGQRRQQVDCRLASRQGEAWKGGTWKGEAWKGEGRGRDAGPVQRREWNG